MDRPQLRSQNAWIGLNDDPQSWKKIMGHDDNSWRWSATGETSTTGYQFWHEVQPDNYETEYCVQMKFGKWGDESCESTFHFVCYTGKKTFNRVDDLMK